MEERPCELAAMSEELVGPVVHNPGDQGLHVAELAIHSQHCRCDAKTIFGCRTQRLMRQSGKSIYREIVYTDADRYSHVSYRYGFISTLHIVVQLY